MTYHELCTDDILSHVINPPEPWTENVQCISVKSEQGAQAAISLTTAWVMELLPHLENCWCCLNKYTTLEHRKVKQKLLSLFKWTLI